MKKTHQRRHTIFIYCEGKTDGLFIQHLKRLYLQRGIKHVAIKTGTGGDYSTFISEVDKNIQARDYDEKYIVLDSNGKSDEELKKAEKLAQTKNIKLIWQKPCLEGIFLRILKNERFIKEKSKDCKSAFNKEYVSDNIPFSENLLKKLFTKDILNSKRQELSELDQLIQSMEKK